MKKFCPLLFVLCTYITHAQIIHSKIPISDIGNTDQQLEIQGLLLNDSIFVAGHSAKKEPTKAFWILPSGKVNKIDSRELKNELIVGFETSGDSVYFYYLEQHKGYVMLAAVMQSRQTGIVTPKNKKIVFTGSFVNIFHSGKQTYLLSMVQEKNEIHLVEITGMKRLDETVLISPFDLYANASPFNFISESETPSPRAAASPNKIYHRGDFIYLCMDKTTSNSESPAKTSILKINLKTRESTNSALIDNSKQQFSTYIQNDYIFKITKSRSRGIVLTIHNLHDFSLSQTFTINEEAEIAQNKSFKKDFTKTTDKESVWDAVSNNSRGFVTATPVDSMNFIIRLGAHHTINRSGAGFIPVFSAFPILAIVGTVAKVVALSLSETESVDQYLYLVWDSKNKPVFIDKPMSAMQAVDVYDVASFKQGRNYEYKGYLQEKEKIFGIYRESGSMQVDIILFKTP
jgi:hypothetical protein